MNKYFTVFKNNLQSNFTYRANTFFMLITESLILIIMLYLWVSVYKNNGLVGNYSLRDMVQYYVLTRFLLLTINANDIAWTIGDEIRLGRLNSFLTKPISYLYYNFFYYAGSVAYRLSLYVVIFALAVFFNFLNFNVDAIRLVYFLLSFFMAGGVYFLIFYLVGISTLYFGFVQGFNFTVTMISYFASGSSIPLDVLPQFLQKTINFLPFKFISFVPISIINGKLEDGEILRLIAEGTVWIIVLYIASIILFKRGIKKYEAVGG